MINLFTFRKKENWVFIIGIDWDIVCEKTSIIWLLIFLNSLYGELFVTKCIFT